MRELLNVNEWSVLSSNKFLFQEDTTHRRLQKHAIEIVHCLNTQRINSSNRNIVFTRLYRVMRMNINAHHFVNIR